MTERLYYADSLLTDFNACVTAVKEENGQTLLSLDRSAFYPTSGGQPFDTGTLRAGDVCLQVTDVNVDASGEVWHTVDGTLDVGMQVHGIIDWPRRRDHMEQHGGEHLLAGAIWRLLGGVTIGLHTGKEDATIDVTLPDGRVHMTQEEIALLEDAVNAHIRENVPVRCYFPSAEELASLPLRKAPTVQEHVRVVQFGDFEYCACGGTHPPYAGMIGLLKILSVTPAKGKARVRFVCGQRALKMFQRTYAAAERTGTLLSCGVDELPDAVENLQHKLQEKDREKNGLSARLGQLLAQEAMRRAIVLPDGCRAVRLVLPSGDRKMLTDCAGQLIAQEKTIALCLMPGDKGGFQAVFAASPDVKWDMGALMRLSGVRGGGKKDFAQGSAADETVLDAALARLSSPE